MSVPDITPTTNHKFAKRNAPQTITILGQEVTVHRPTQADIERQLAAFETKYGMTSAEFLAKGRRGELNCSDDFFDWSWYCKLMSQITGSADFKIREVEAQKLVID